MPSIPYVELSNYAIVQVAVAVVIIGTWVLAVLRGRAGSKSAPKADSPRWYEQRIFLDGPIKAVTDSLGGIYRVLTEIRAENSDAVREFRDKIDIEIRVLAELKNSIDNLKDAILRRR